VRPPAGKAWQTRASQQVNKSGKQKLAHGLNTMAPIPASKNNPAFEEDFKGFNAPGQVGQATLRKDDADEGSESSEGSEAEGLYEGMNDLPPSKLKRDITTDDANGAMSLEAVDFEGFELLETNHVGLETLPKLILQRLKEFNRYKNILPNPPTRVILDQVGSDPGSKFINANFIENWNGNRKGYIAAQGPKDTTIPHFWRMVWQEDVRTIIMTTGLMEGTKQKCARYWPQELYKEAENKGYHVHGGIAVGVVSGAKRDGYKIADLTVWAVANPAEKRHIKHFWFDTWPDYGVPQDGLVLPKMLTAVREWNNVDEQPWLVHCSAGIGRTGTLLGIDIGMDSLEATNYADAINIVDAMRVGRGGMVQTPEQYEFVHKCLEDYALLRNNERGVGQSTSEGGNMYGNVEDEELGMEMEA